MRANKALILIQFGQRACLVECLAKSAQSHALPFDLPFDGNPEGVSRNHILVRRKCGLFWIHPDRVLLILPPAGQLSRAGAAIFPGRGDIVLITHSNQRYFVAYRWKHSHTNKLMCKPRPRHTCTYTCNISNAIREVLYRACLPICLRETS